MRSEPKRFNVGDTVRVRSVIFSRFVGRVGTIIHAQPSRAGGRTLDRYGVVFPDGSEAEFWDVQLEMNTDNASLPPRVVA